MKLEVILLHPKFCKNPIPSQINQVHNIKTCSFIIHLISFNIYFNFPTRSTCSTHPIAINFVVIITYTKSTSYEVSHRVNVLFSFYVLVLSSTYITQRLLGSGQARLSCGYHCSNNDNKLTS